MRAVALTPLGGAVPEAHEVFPTLQTEVWSWGHSEHGQLGHGDSLARSDQRTIKREHDEELRRGGNVMITLISECVCVCVCRSQPLCIKSLNVKEVVRVAAGAHHSLALTAQSQVSPRCFLIM